ncbi:class I adenylate-forming enzyme family protein [Frankia sp. Cppng1_Ct_nod]|uniref:class I adenylate-forming enzyme family protein n=1 Tax=Frankia sp. Cppng1_Ct_nod TaxID=2897162 RepID=UPI0020259F74|nr:class I adenylate-forming enzyme family protein [Frankia sp. Cppng1_Ct_nod]
MVRLTAAHWPADTSVELVEESVGNWLRHVAHRHPDRPALRWSVGEGLETLTYAGLVADAGAVAAGLLGVVEPGDRIALWAPNCVDWIIVQCASALAGTVLVPVNTSLRDDEVRHELRQSGARLVIAAAEHRGSPLRERAEALARELPRPARVLPLEELRLALPAQSGPLPVVSPQAPFLIQYTSGTTGRPKGAVLSHFAVLNTGRIAGRVFQAPLVWCSGLPLHHVGGSVSGVLMTFGAEGTMVLSPGFEPGRTLRLIEQAQVTALGAVPTMLYDLLAYPALTSHDISSLQVIQTGGTTVPPALIRRAEAVLGCRVIISYGQSEAPNATACLPSDSDLIKAETLGRALAHREARISVPGTGTGGDTGGTAGIGEHGELLIRSSLSMSGYHDDPDATSRTLDDDGWLHTGDLCSMDADGILRIHGRIRDVIIRGGENIYPREVEETLLEHPAVADVAVVGAPDDRLGEVPVAFVVPAPGQETDAAELAAFTRSRLAYFKVPVDWCVVDALPRTASGKVQKFLLRQSVARTE